MKNGNSDNILKNPLFWIVSTIISIAYAIYYCIKFENYIIIPIAIIVLPIFFFFCNKIFNKM